MRRSRISSRFQSSLIARPACPYLQPEPESYVAFVAAETRTLGAGGKGLRRTREPERSGGLDRLAAGGRRATITARGRWPTLPPPPTPPNARRTRKTGGLKATRASARRAASSATSSQASSRLRTSLAAPWIGCLGGGVDNRREERQPSVAPAERRDDSKSPCLAPVTARLVTPVTASAVAVQ